MVTLELAYNFDKASLDDVTSSLNGVTSSYLKANILI